MRRFLSKSLAMVVLLCGLVGIPAQATVVSMPTTNQKVVPDSTAAPEATESFDPNIVLKVQYDYDNKVRANFVVPAFIEIENNGAELDGEVRIFITPEYGKEALVYCLGVHVEANDTASFVLPFKAGTTRNIQTYLYQNDKAVAKAKLGKKGVTLATNSLVGILSSDPQGMNHWQGLTKLTDAEGYECMVKAVNLDEDRFPEEQFLLDRFALLVLNHYDINTLNQKQQAALTGWVQGGGVLLVDGDLANTQGIASLQPIIDLTVNGEIPADEVVQKMYAVANTKYSSQKAIETLGVVEPMGAVHYGSEEQPMLLRYEAGSGKVFVSTFSLAAPALSHRGVVTGYFGRVKGMSSIASSIAEAMAYGYFNTNQMREAVRGIEWLDATAIGGILIAMVIFIILVGPVNYAILAKKDRRDWIWVTAPVLTLIFCGVFFGIGISRQGNTPISSVVSVLDNRVYGQESHSEIGVGMPQMGNCEVTLNIEGFPTKEMTSEYYYDDSDTGKLERGKPVMLFDLSGQTKAQFPELGRLNMESFGVTREDLALEGGLVASASFGGDKILYQVKNETGAMLEDVTLALPTGYVRIPVLEAGEERSGEFTIYQMMQGANMGYSQTTIDYWMVFGELYGGAEFINNYYGASQSTEDERTEKEQRTDYIKQMMMEHALRQEMQTMGYTTNESRGWNYAAWGWSRELGAVEVSVNGKPARNEQNLTVVLGDLQVNFINSEGVSIPQGYLWGKASDVSKMGEGWLYPTEQGGTLVGGEIVFSFDLGADPMTYDFETLTIYESYSYGVFDVSLKNQRTGQWDTYRLGKTVKGNGAAQDYVNESGVVEMKISKEADQMQDGQREATFEGFSIAVEGKVK